jgi:putative membrane protein
MPSEQRLHPISILFGFAGSLKAFALPGILVLVAGRSSRGGADGSFGRLPPNWEIWMMLLLIPAGLMAVARYLSFRIRYDSTELVIRSGILFRNERHIPYSRIQNLEAVRNIFHRAFGVVEVRVENASAKETEARISVLPLAAFEEMRQRVIEGKARIGAAASPSEPSEPALTGVSSGVPDETLLQLRVRDLLLFGFLENRGLVIIGAIYGFLWEFGPLAGFWSRLMDEGSTRTGIVRDTIRMVFSGNLPPPGRIGVALAGIAGFLILVRLVSMVWATVRLYGFRLTRTGEDLRAEFGLFTRVAATIPVRRIQTITIRESPLHRLTGRVTVRVETAGGGQAGQPGAVVDREWLAPLVRVSELPAILRHVAPEVDLAAIDWQPVHPRAFRRAIKPAMVFGVAVPAAVAAVAGWWGLSLLPVTLGWFALAARKHVAHLGWAAADDVVVFRTGWLWRLMTVARVSKIQVVSWRESPFDRRTAMARVRVDTAGASERSVRVDIPYLPRDVAHDLHRRLAAGAARTDFRW